MTPRRRAVEFVLRVLILVVGLDIFAYSIGGARPLSIRLIGAATLAACLYFGLIDWTRLRRN